MVIKSFLCLWECCKLKKRIDSISQNCWEPLNIYKILNRSGRTILLTWLILTVVIEIYNTQKDLEPLIMQVHTQELPEMQIKVFIVMTFRLSKEDLGQVLKMQINQEKPQREFKRAVLLWEDKGVSSKFKTISWDRTSVQCKEWVL